MILPLKVIKFIFKRELKIIILKCEKQSVTCRLTAELSNSRDDSIYLRGKASAYDEIVHYLEKEIIKLTR